MFQFLTGRLQGVPRVTIQQRGSAKWVTRYKTKIKCSVNCEPQQPYYCRDMNEINTVLFPDSPYFDLTDTQLTLFVTSKFNLSIPAVPPWCVSAYHVIDCRESASSLLAYCYSLLIYFDAADSAGTFIAMQIIRWRVSASDGQNYTLATQCVNYTPMEDWISVPLCERPVWQKPFCGWCG